MSTTRAVFLLLAFCTFQSSAEPAIRVHENLTANLTCYKSRPSEWWVLPNQEIVTLNQSWTRVTLDEDGQWLRIGNVSIEDAGTYLCAYKQNLTDILTIHEVRLDVVPDFKTGPVWELYETNFVTGLIAAGAVLGVIVMTCMVFKFRWKDPKIKKGDRQGLHPADYFEGPIAVERF